MKPVLHSLPFQQYICPTHLSFFSAILKYARMHAGKTGFFLLNVSLSHELTFYIKQKKLDTRNDIYNSISLGLLCCGWRERVCSAHTRRQLTASFRYNITCGTKIVELIEQNVYISCFTFQ